MKQGRCGSMTHDYKRLGTTALFAALDIASGRVVGSTYRRHRHQGVLRFLREIDRAVPADVSGYEARQGYLSPDVQVSSYGHSRRFARTGLHSRWLKSMPALSTGAR